MIFVRAHVWYLYARMYNIYVRTHTISVRSRIKFVCAPVWYLCTRPCDICVLARVIFVHSPVWYLCVRTYGICARALLIRFFTPINHIYITSSITFMCASSSYWYTRAITLCTTGCDQWDHKKRRASVCQKYRACARHMLGLSAKCLWANE